MKTMTWKTKLIIAAIILALALAGFGIVSAMSYGSLLLAFVSWVVGTFCGWYGKNVYDKYFANK
jgi:Na+/H+ antiporter NhaC